MKKALDAVLSFHKAFLRHSETLPTSNIPDHMKHERIILLTEENKELIHAIEHESIEQITKELCDVLYAVFGTAVAFGLTSKLEAAFHEVHRSNMSKLDEQGKPLIREDGKILKSSCYSNANIASVLEQ